MRAAQNEMERVSLEVQAAERDYDLNRAAELKYGTLLQLQKQLREAEEMLEREMVRALPLLAPASKQPRCMLLPAYLCVCCKSSSWDGCMPGLHAFRMLHKISGLVCCLPSQVVFAARRCMAGCMPGLAWLGKGDCYACFDLSMSLPRCAQPGDAKRMLREEVTEQDIADIISMWTGIPVSKLVATEREKLLQLGEELHRRVIGQDEAVEAVADAIQRCATPNPEPKTLETSNSVRIGQDAAVKAGSNPIQQLHSPCATLPTP